MNDNESKKRNASAGLVERRVVLSVTYSTKEKRYINPVAFQFVSKNAELEAVRILRWPCGPGRYYYQADLIAPDDAEFSNDGTIRENIVRKLNPHFKPKNFLFIDNKCVLHNAKIAGGDSRPVD